MCHIFGMIPLCFQKFNVISVVFFPVSMTLQKVKVLVTKLLKLGAADVVLTYSREQVRISKVFSWINNPFVLREPLEMTSE